MRALSLLSTVTLFWATASALSLPWSTKSHHKRAKGNKKAHSDFKYFKEPGGSLDLSHYDIRYFKDQLPYEKHRLVLRNLIRSYLSTTDGQGVETWIAHGTLLGWWWNGRIMPWDWDIDVQVSGATLAWMASNMNGTEHRYVWTDEWEGNEHAEKYLLDVNPYHRRTDRGDGQNVIDARWIDLSNGAFVDITGLSERQPDRRPGVWSCKDFHKYHTEDLFPLRRTEFEGMPATVPFNFERILTDEYGPRSIVRTAWEG